MENDPYDPYASPTTSVQPTGHSGYAAISQGVIQQLAATKPWVRFISVLMFIGAGLLLLAALLIILMGNALASATKNQMFTGEMAVFIAGFYGVLAFIFIFPALKLWKYATCIGILVASGATFDLEMALNEQRSYWKFIGILCLIFVGFYALIFIGAMILGGIGAMIGR